MNLPFLKKKPAPIKREYLFALEISHCQVKSAVWSVINSRPQVLSQGAPVSWDDQTDASLLAACDSCLSDSSAKLDATGKTDISQVILGLPSDWLSGDKIDPNYLKLIKLVLQKLSLKAVGFVVTADAVVRYLHSQDGVPPTAILIGLSPDVLEITLVRLGKVDSIQLVKRSQQIVADVTEGLSRFSQVSLFPSRMLLYDSGSDLESIKQVLLSHPWQSHGNKLPFLHFPKIDSLAADFTIKAIALAGGSEVAQALGILSAPAEPASTPAKAADAEAKHLAPEELGFIADSDVLEEVPVVAEESLPPEEAVEPAYRPEPIVPVRAPVPLVPEMTEDQLPRRSHPRPKFTFPQLRFPQLSFLPVLLVLLLVVAGGLFAAYWYLPVATVTVSVTPKSLEHQFVLVADTQATAVDPNTLSIPARFAEVTVNGEKNAAATGSKVVGDRATGSVTIINGTSVPKTFASGTVITSPSGLKYTFDSQVVVASASGTADPSSYTPGKANVNITASQIGSDSNLSAGTQFKVSSFSSLDYVARNEAAFSGGSSRQAQVVSKDDLNSLRSELSSQLKNDAQSQLTSQISASDVLVAPSLALTTVSETFNHKADEVADSVNLQLSVKAKGLVFSKSDFDSLTTAQLNSLIPSGYALSGSPTSNFAVKSTAAQKTQLNVNLSASLSPQFDTAGIIAAIAGRTPESAKTYLQSLPNVSSAEFAIRPPLPSQLVTLPHVSKNIKLNIVSSQ